MCNFQDAVRYDRFSRTAGLVIRVTLVVRSGVLLTLTATSTEERLAWSYEIGPAATADANGLSDDRRSTLPHCLACSPAIAPRVVLKQRA